MQICGTPSALEEFFTWLGSSLTSALKKRARRRKAAKPRKKTGTHKKRAVRKPATAGAKVLPFKRAS